MFAKWVLCGLCGSSEKDKGVWVAGCVQKKGDGWKDGLFGLVVVDCKGCSGGRLDGSTMGDQEVVRTL